MPTTTTRRATDVVLRRVPIVRAVGGPREVREAAAVLDRQRRRDGTMQLASDLALSLPHVVLLLWRLVRDSSVRWRHRLAVAGVAAYLVTPLDPIPDFLPIVGSLDDALVAFVVLRWVLRSVDRAVLDEHWGGRPAMLDAIRALSGGQQQAKRVRATSGDT